MVQLAGNKALSPSEIGPRSRLARLRRIDGRRREAKYLKSIEDALLRHCGGPGHASVPQRLLVQRIAADMLRLELLDQRMLAGEASDHEHRIASALRNHVRLGLQVIGIEKAEPDATASLLDDYLANRTSDVDSHE